MPEALEQLEHGQLYFFRFWPNPRVPQVAVGVYTIWRNTELIHVGMAGHSLTADQISVHRVDTVRNKGLYPRLAMLHDGEVVTSSVSILPTDSCSSDSLPSR